MGSEEGVAAFESRLLGKGEQDIFEWVGVLLLSIIIIIIPSPPVLKFAPGAGRGLLTGPRIGRGSGGGGLFKGGLRKSGIRARVAGKLRFDCKKPTGPARFLSPLEGGERELFAPSCPAAPRLGPSARCAFARSGCAGNRQTPGSRPRFPGEGDLNCAVARRLHCSSGPLGSASGL